MAKTKQQAAPTLKVGDRIWKMKPAGYPKDGMGIFTDVQVLDETSRSWVVGHPEFRWGWEKVPKNGPHPGFAFTIDEAVAMVYERSSYMIGAEVQRISDPNILRQIADLIGWKPEGMR